VEGVVRGCARAIRQALTIGNDLPETELRQIIRGMDDGDGAPRIYQNRFECVTSQLAFRPPRPPRVRRHVTETATVMGPPGQDIYHDKFGRVKVQFHWDREGELDANTSCWLRVAQPWAGAGYGFQFFPRIGMEVLVTFIGGDTDRPVVVGALYNGTHATPEVLPERMTRSGIRTQTSPKGGGFNELSFEDAKDKERVYIHAQRNFENVIQHDHDMTVGNRQSFSIGGDQRTGVAGDQRFTVGNNRSTSVGGNASSFVEGSLTTRVVTNQLQMVEGNNNTLIGGANVRRVQQSDLTAVKGVYNVTARAGASFMVTGGVETNTSATAFVKGSAHLTASQRVVVRTQEEEDPAVIRLECGTSIIELHPDRIEIVGDTISMRGRSRTDVYGNKSHLMLKDKGITNRGDNVELVTLDGSAFVRLKKERGGLIGIKAGKGVYMEGGDVVIAAAIDLVLNGAMNVNFLSLPMPELTPLRRLSSPEDQEEQPPNVTLRFTHLATDDSEPIADTPYRASAGEYTHEGTTDPNGEIQIYVPDGVDFVDVSLFAHEEYEDLYPDPTPLQWNVFITSEIPSASEHMGAAVRLKNLGYDLAVPSSEGDPSFVAALAAFQFDHDIAQTGENDEDTQNKLQEVYGS
jgi:type VI secretion system secreted protein VgrG